MSLRPRELVLDSRLALLRMGNLPATHKNKIAKISTGIVRQTVNRQIYGSRPSSGIKLRPTSSLRREDTMFSLSTEVPSNQGKKFKA
jgi:hypothetical protein